MLIVGFIVETIRQATRIANLLRLVRTMAEEIRKFSFEKFSFICTNPKYNLCEYDHDDNRFLSCIHKAAR